MDSRNVSMSLSDFLLEFHDFIYCTHLFRICVLVLMRKSSYRHTNNLLEKNLSQYLLIRAWFVISFVIYAHNKLEYPKYFSQTLFLKYVEWIWLIIIIIWVKKVFFLKVGYLEIYLPLLDNRIIFFFFTKIL